MAIPDWGLLQTFLHVAERGSFTGAAKALAISQPTLSRRMQALERHLGTALFVRHARGLQLTERGTALRESVQALALDIDAVVRRASGARENPIGDVRVSANEPLGVHVLMGAFAQLRESHPRVHIELVIENRAVDLNKREADIAVRMFQTQQPDLIARRIGRVSTGLFASPVYLDRHGRPKRPEQLGRHTLIGFDRNWPKRLAAQKLKPHDFAFRSDSLLAHAEAVRAGVGIAGLHCKLAARWGLERVLPQLLLEPLEVWLVTHSELRTNAAVRRVFEALGRELQSYVDSSSSAPASSDVQERSGGP